MEDENRLREIDRHLAAVLEPDTAVVRRVLAGGFAEHADDRQRTMGLPAAIVAAIAIAAVISSALYWQWPIGSASGRAELTITGTDSSIIVERADGKRWFFGPEPDPDASSGSYVIAIPNQGELR